MTKKVILFISGLQKGEASGKELLETQVCAEYYKRNGSHYLLYEENQEGFKQASKNRIKIKGKIVELTRQGLLQTQMIFEEKKKHITNYVTPYGNLLLGIDTKRVDIEETKESLKVTIEYILEMNEQYLSDSKIMLQVRQNLLED